MATRDPRDRFLEELEPLAVELREVEKEASDVAARTRQAGDEPGGDGIGFEIQADDGNCLRRVGRRPDGGRAHGEDHVGAEANRLRRVLAQPLLATTGEAIIDDDVLPLHVAELAKSTPKCLLWLEHHWRGGDRWNRVQLDNPEELGSLLRLGGQQIEEHEVGRRGPDLAEGVGAAVTFRDVEAVALHVKGEQLADVRLVLDDEHPAGHEGLILSAARLAHLENKGAVGSDPPAESRDKKARAEAVRTRQIRALLTEALEARQLPGWHDDLRAVCRPSPHPTAPRPGRLKSGLAANLALGRALRAGSRVILVYGSAAPSSSYSPQMENCARSRAGEPQVSTQRAPRLATRHYKTSQ